MQLLKHWILWVKGKNHLFLLILTNSNPREAGDLFDALIIFGLDSTILYSNFISLSEVRSVLIMQKKWSTLIFLFPPHQMISFSGGLNWLSAWMIKVLECKILVSWLMICFDSPTLPYPTPSLLLSSWIMDPVSLGGSSSRPGQFNYGLNILA